MPGFNYLPRMDQCFLNFQRRLHHVKAGLRLSAPLTKQTLFYSFKA